MRLNVGCRATNLVINWSSCHCHLTPIQTGTLHLHHHQHQRCHRHHHHHHHQHCRTKPSVASAQNVWLIPLRSLSRKSLLVVSLSQLGMFCFPTRLQPALELTTQNQQQLWKSCFCFETIHFEFLQRAMSLDVSS